MYARDVMTSPIQVVDPRATVAHARNLMVRHHISRLPVMEGEKLTGIITKKDIAYRLRQGEPAWRRRPLDRIPVEALATASPVVENGAVTGIVTKTDLMKSALVRGLRCTAGDVMEDVATVSRYHSLEHVITVMRERDDKVLVLNDDGTLAGIITETNLAFFDDEPKISGVVGKDVTITRRERADGSSGQGMLVVASVTAEDVMTSPVITTPAATPLPEAIALMAKHHVNSLVVMENDAICGIIKRDDIIKEVAK